MLPNFNKRVMKYRILYSYICVHQANSEVVGLQAYSCLPVSVQSVFLQTATIGYWAVTSPLKGFNTGLLARAPLL